MADWAKLTAFDATLRTGTRIGAADFGPEDQVPLEAGSGDVLILSHAPSRRFLGGEPLHESVMIELLWPLADARPGPLRVGRAVYRAGTERVLYQSSQLSGVLSLVSKDPARFSLEGNLAFAPQLDVESRGPRALAGSISIDR